MSEPLYRSPRVAIYEDQAVINDGAKDVTVVFSELTGIAREPKQDSWLHSTSAVAPEVGNRWFPLQIPRHLAEQLMTTVGAGSIPVKPWPQQEPVNPCPNCGRSHYPGTWHCQSCGKDIVDAETVISPEQKVLVREYADRFAYQKDAAALSMAGWTVVTVTEAKQNAGILRILTWGCFPSLSDLTHI